MRNVLLPLTTILGFASAGCGGGAEVPPVPAPPAPQIVFGDLHVHSTNSIDVYVLEAPILGGRGEVGPAAHCAFARHCSRLDFWAITDHQEGAPPSTWQESKDAVTLCNAQYGGDDPNPEMVSFAGFEWQQSSPDPETDWGHKNVLFRDYRDADVPTHAIASVGQVTTVTADDVEAAVTLATAVDPDNAEVYAALEAEVTAGLVAAECPAGVPSTDLPLDCVEYAADPATLYAKLDEWGIDALVIPHGYTWAAHHGPLTTWAHQLDPVQHDPRYQTLLEIYSGHGSMEEYRTWLPVEVAPDGAATCPEPTDDYLPCCWRAGELVDPADAAAARQAFVDAGRDGFETLPTARPEDWLDCGECRDCFQPAEGHRPLGSAQSALARTHFGEDGEPLRYTWGFLGSTDTHAVGPGAGFKEAKWMSDIFGSAKPEFDVLVNLMVPQLFPDWVRQNSYYYSGGLVAAHTVGRSRDAIWDALKRREVYATSGERIGLWFDLVNGPDGRRPMGSEVVMTAAPQFEVRAVGSFVQAPGCPEDLAAASGGVVDEVCFGECYNPTDERYLI
ncbi:MAG: DUF3604 domain-containing protein, partial [Deltaproteobacteria bacterium]|nr:DUF3604 domain-containing protein [Deltaproteobacteria bacterium]